MDAGRSIGRTPTVADRAQVAAVLKRCLRTVNCPDRCRLYYTSRVRLV